MFSIIDSLFTVFICDIQLQTCSLFVSNKPASHGTNKKPKVDQATKGVKRKLEDSQLDDDAFTTPTKCARRTRTADDLTSRTVKENFADFNDHQLHVLRAEANHNRTLNEELVMQSNLRMSKSPLAQKMGKRLQPQAESVPVG